MKNNVSTRNNSIDMLKFLCMIGIILIHLTGQGGLISYSHNNLFSYNFYLLFNNLLKNCLNIFCIITGYLYISKKYIKNKNIINIIVNVLIYSLVVVFVFYICNLFDIRSLGFKYFINSIFPSMIGRYWFITCYVLLFFLMPYINFFIKSINKEYLKKLLVLLFIILCIIPELFCYDYFRLQYGYSPFWLIYLYMVGSYIKLYGINISNKKAIIILLISTIINCLFVIITKNFLNNSNYYYNLGYYFVSPLMVISSVSLFLLFTKIKVKDGLASKLGKYSLAVYIIHCHRLIYDWIIKDNMIFIKPYNIIIELIILILISIAVYLICVLVDIVRNKIFKFFKIDVLIDNLGSKMDEVLLWK